MAGKQLDVIMCPLCNEYSSKRITSVEKHVNNVHNTTLQLIWDNQNNGPTVCGCGCGQQTKWLNWKHGYAKFIKGHNANIYSVYDEKIAKEISEKRAEKLRGKKGWSAGLTKETDQRIANIATATATGRRLAFAEKKIAIWSKGLTKDNDERLLHVSTVLKQKFQNGTKTQWSSGLTEDVDQRLKTRNDNLRLKYTNGNLTTWNKGKTKVIDERIKKTWENRDPSMEYQHIRWTHEEIEKQLETNINISLEKIQNYRNDRSPALTIRCRNCNWSAVVSLLFAKSDRCPYCHPNCSNGQREISDWITSLGFFVGNNVRGIIGRQELDIYVPAKMLAIEFNGLYYHNEAAGKDQHYHQTKTDKSLKLGIQLFHVFEDEWLLKRDIVKSMIRNKLGITKERIYARKCSIIELDNITKKTFFEENHIDGDTQSIVTFGLTYNNSIIAALSLRRPFHKIYNNCLEVGRFCSLKDTTVVGGLSKLTAIAKAYAKQQNINRIISYVDTRFGTGNGWKQSGWCVFQKTKERFWWTDKRQRFNRFKFKADKTNNISEFDVATKANVVKIWGCCNLIFEITGSLTQ